MKRITAYLKGKLEEIKCSSREKKVNSALEAARINFEEQISDADIKIDKLMREIGESDDIQSIIQYPTAWTIRKKQNAELSGWKKSRRLCMKKFKRANIMN